MSIMTYQPTFLVFDNSNPAAKNHPLNTALTYCRIYFLSDILCHNYKNLYWYEHCSLVLINSLAPGRFQFNFRYIFFKLNLVNGGWGIFYEIAPRWMPLDLTNDKSTLVQVMAWCRQATSHYLSQCWPRSMSPNGVTRPQWVKTKEQCT